MQLVAMLRALIALDPENLAEYAVVIPGEEVARVEEGAASATDVAASEMARLEHTSVQGHMLRYGIYLGLSMALEEKMDSTELVALAERMAIEVGAKDPIVRHPYTMDARSAEFLQEIRSQRAEKKRE